ncbi:uncharacterized protein BDR25DRAFT_248285, partial [Lindgomyces ingoldianus]
TGAMLSMLNSVKVLLGKDDRRDYRSAGVEQTMAAKYISAERRSLLLIITYPTKTYCNNWTTYLTPS